MEPIEKRKRYLKERFSDEFEEAFEEPKKSDILVEKQVKEGKKKT